MTDQFIDREIGERRTRAHTRIFRLDLISQFQINDNLAVDLPFDGCRINRQLYKILQPLALEQVSNSIERACEGDSML